MNYYVSYGGGVNSTALTILLLTDPRFAGKPWRDNPSLLRVIMADTGSEQPETYAYVKDVFDPWLKVLGHRGVEWCGQEVSLERYCLDAKIIPARMRRWCSDKWKVRPIVEYLRQNNLLPTVQYMGIHAGEFSRMRSSGVKKIENAFPLIDLGVDQAGCLEVIARAGLEAPRKSGCFFCPYSKKGAVIALEREHPDLFHRAVELERNNSGFERGFHLFSKKYALPEWIVKGRVRKDNSGGCAAKCFTGNMSENTTRNATL